MPYLFGGRRYLLQAIFRRGEIGPERSSRLFFRWSKITKACSSFDVPGRADVRHYEIILMLPIFACHCGSGYLRKNAKTATGAVLIKHYVRSSWHNSSPASHAMFHSFELCHTVSEAWMKQ